MFFMHFPIFHASFICRCFKREFPLVVDMQRIDPIKLGISGRNLGARITATHWHRISSRSSESELRLCWDTVTWPWKSSGCVTVYQCETLLVNVYIFFCIFFTLWWDWSVVSGALFPEDYLPCRSWCASSVRLGRRRCFWLLGSREGYPGGGTTRPDFTDFWTNQAFSSSSCCYLVVLLLVVAAAVVAAVPITLLLDFGGTIVLMLKDGRLVGRIGGCIQYH